MEKHQLDDLVSWIQDRFDYEFSLAQEATLRQIFEQAPPDPNGPTHQDIYEELCRLEID